MSPSHCVWGVSQIDIVPPNNQSDCWWGEKYHQKVNQKDAQLSNIFIWKAFKMMAEINGLSSSTKMIWKWFVVVITKLKIPPYFNGKFSDEKLFSIYNPITMTFTLKQWPKNRRCSVDDFFLSFQFILNQNRRHLITITKSIDEQLWWLIVFAMGKCTHKISNNNKIERLWLL